MIDSILIFSRSTPHHHTGGMETLAWSLAVEWARTVQNVELVTTAVPGRSGPFSEDGVTVVPLPGAPSGRYSRDWWAGARQHWTAREVAPDVVLSVSAGAYSVVRDRSRHPGTPFVMQAHGTSAMEIGSKLRAPDLRSLAATPRNAAALVRDLARYRDFDGVVAVGDKVVESLVARPQRWAVPPDRVHLIPNGVRVAEHGFDDRTRREFRAALGVDDTVTVVGCVGRLHVQKRLDRVLRGAAELRDRGSAGRYRFLLVGDGPDEARLRGLSRALGIVDMVTFTGRVDRRMVRSWYSAADLALLTTARLEGLPMAVLEALANGLPCLVPAGAVGSVALDRVLSQVDPTDSRALADVLAGLAGGDRSRVSLLPAEFTLEHCARRYLALFEELVPGPGVGRAGGGS